MSQIKLSQNFIRNIVKLALNEDLYPSGDITSNLIKNKKIIKTKIITNQNAIIGGLLFAKHATEIQLSFPINPVHQLSSGSAKDTWKHSVF